jgi:Na+-translocating ferredoxin:NAD+ oxidoreductase subunit G
MAKRESTFTNMVVTLFAVTFIAAAALGFVYDLTKDAIELSKMKARSEAIEKVLPEFDELGVVESSSSPQLTTALNFSCIKNGEELGWQ